MKRLALAAVTILVFGVAGCGSSNKPTAPSDITIFTVQLSALNENPPVTNSFPAGSAVNIAHIHGPNAPAGTNAGVLVNTTLAAGQVVLTNGSGTFSFDDIVTSADNVSQILANPQNFYFNAHSTLNGGGAVRGQLR
jgi:hypothetical protein